MDRHGNLTAQRQNAVVDEQAARWHVAMSSEVVSERQRKEFERWLAASPHNRAAYDAIGRAWDIAGEEAGESAIMEMREAALRFRIPPRASVWRAPTFWAACVFCGLLGGLWWNGWSPHQASQTARVALSPKHTVLENVREGSFESNVGERRTIRLIDGSIITLDTASRLAVNVGAKERRVQLLAGQASFDVAKDKTRPFTVYAGDRRITAVGTAFDVRLDPVEVRVVMVEGRVAVDQIAPSQSLTRAQTTKPAMQLVAGEQLVAAIGGDPSIGDANVQRSTSWREGRLVFEGDRLADAVAEMNRYSRKPIVIVDPAIGQMKVSGVFSTDRPEAFAVALTNYFDVEAVDQDRVTVLRWRR